MSVIATLPPAARITGSPVRPGYKLQRGTAHSFLVRVFLNQVDRQVFNAVLPLIKTGLQATDVQLGLGATGFTLIYGMLVPVAVFFGDRISRKWIVVVSLLTFSLGSVLTGVSGGLLTLLFVRIVATGAGEAFYYPAANALIGEHHQHTRAQAMTVHQSALYVGTIVSSLAAGYIGERHGWRATFFIFGFLGLAVAAVPRCSFALRRGATSPGKPYVSMAA